MCLQVNQQYVQVQAIVSQVSSIKLYKFEYVTRRGKTTLGKLQVGVWKGQAQTVDAWHNPDNDSEETADPAYLNEARPQELPGILWLVQDTSMLSVPLISFSLSEIDNK